MQQLFVDNLEDDLLCDRQPQARAAGVGDAGLVQPVKFIKEQGELFRGNVVPLVLEGNADLFGRFFG